MDNTENTYYELIIRYLSGDSSDEDTQRLFFWINSNSENESLFFTIKDLYEASAWQQIKKEANTENEWLKIQKTIQNNYTHKKFNYSILKRVLSYAAIFLFGMFATYLITQQTKQSFLVSSSCKSSLTKVVTGKGERTKIILPDGTKVWVNACSSLSYNGNYGNKYRIVHLDGEAFFEVKKDANKPFIVNSMGFNIKAHGTSFDVSAYKEDKKVSAVLVEGSISFRQNNDDNQQLIKPGQKIAYSQKENTIRVDNVDTDNYTAWRTGEYRFEQLTFEEVAKRMERIYNINFVFKNSEAKKIPFTGTFFSYESLDKILMVININTAIRFVKNKDTVLIY